SPSCMSPGLTATVISSLSSGSMTGRPSSSVLGITHSQIEGKAAAELRGTATALLGLFKRPAGLGYGGIRSPPAKSKNAAKNLRFLFNRLKLWCAPATRPQHTI